MPRRYDKNAHGHGARHSGSVADLDHFDSPEGTFDLVTMIRYVNRDLGLRAAAGLAPNGWLLVEQHLETRRRVFGPTGAFRVRPGELLRAFAALRIVEYWEGPVDRDGKAVLARPAACSGDPGF